MILACSGLDGFHVPAGLFSARRNMYLRGSQWNMRKKRRRSNPLLVVFLLLMVAGAVYVNQVIVPDVPPLFIDTPTPTRDPESYVTEAEALFNEGKLSQAIASYEQAVIHKPNDPSIYIALARTQMFSGRYADAQQSAENAILLNQNNSMAHALRGWALYFQEDFLNAEAALQRALELDPNNAMAHAYYAELIADLYTRGQASLDAVDKMSAESNTAIALAPNSLEAHRARGYVYFVTGNYEESVREYKQALSINDNIADVHLLLGLLYRAMASDLNSTDPNPAKYYVDAVESFTRAYTLNPSDPIPNLYISRIYATNGEFAKAIQYAKQVVGDAPANALYHGNLGVMYYRNLQYPEAIDQLSLLVNGGKTEDGQDIAAVQLGAEPRIAEYYYIYGLALVKQNRCGDAIPIFQQLLTQVPDDAIATDNANEGLRICSENIGVTPSPEPTLEAEATPTP
jgi:tetratricopeptide (TPR) repeat protein